MGIPTVKDRVVQAAAVLVLMPIFEADMHEHSYAYRPGRNAHQAMAAIQTGIEGGQFEIIDADLSGYFDTIPHRPLLRLVARLLYEFRTTVRPCTPHRQFTLSQDDECLPFHPWLA